MSSFQSLAALYVKGPAFEDGRESATRGLVEDATTQQVKKVYEAARTNKNGTFVAREQLKELQYNNAGIASRFEEVK